MKQFLIAAVLAAALPGAAAAATLTFDEGSLPATGYTIDPALPNGYFGFNFDNFYLLDPTQWPGWDTSAAKSSPNVAINGFGAPAQITRGSAFDFVSGWFANGFNGVTVTIQARDTIGGAVSHTATFDTGVDPALQTFNWSGVRELDFSGAPTSGSGYAHFSMDNVRVNFAGSGAPEPASWGLMIVGFGGAGAMLRRRAAQAAAGRTTICG